LDQAYRNLVLSVAVWRQNGDRKYVFNAYFMSLRVTKNNLTQRHAE